MLEMKCDEGAKAGGVLILEHRRKGELLTLRTLSNLEMDSYKALRANLRIALGTPPTHIAIGTGTTAVAVGDSAIEAQVDKQLATKTRVTITVTNDASQYTYTFTLAADTDVTEAGLLSGDDLCYHQVFTAIPCLATETLKVTWRSQST